MVRFLPAVLLVSSLVQPAAGGPDFAREIQPLLNKHCANCHGGVKQKGGLNLSNRASALEGGQSGRGLLVGGKLDESELYLRITHDDPDERMPPEQPLTPAETELVSQWIREGAEWPEHWSFAPARQPAVPDTRNSDWPLDPIDHFVLARLQEEDLPPSPEAPPHVLLRRLHLDLTGLPPTLEEQDSFHASWQEDPEAALARTVDQLLSSPHYGERWGRHWLDQARYADSDGYEKDNARPHAWVWRDWVIRAINDDLPFDRFTIEQLAGDLLPDGTPQQHLATGFHRQTLFNREGGVDPEEDRTKRTIDRTTTVARAWLGLTLECAQCHDHPYDPIPMRDFYRAYAFFNAADEQSIKLPGEKGTRKQEAHVLKDNPKRKTYLFHRGDFLQPDLEAGEVRGGTPAFLPPLSPQDADRPNRLDLARWLVAPENPLTARVAVNTIWLHLFGAGLCSTPDNFGSQGALPSHPALLDWLAHTFREEGWSRKALIRRIVLSRTYRQTSRHRPEAAERDPENRLLSRQNRRRVEAEIVRDLHLAVAGQLDRRVGGRSVFPPVPDDVVAQSYANNYQWKESTGPDRYRRGLYTFFKRTAPDPNLMIFDCPDSNTSVTQRNRSNTPLMALATLQNTVFHEAARGFAARIVAAGGSAEERFDRAFRIALARTPTASELEVLGGLLEDYQLYYSINTDEAEKLAGDFVPEDSDAAATAPWVAVLRIVTNLDEFLTCP